MGSGTRNSYEGFLPRRAIVMARAGVAPRAQAPLRPSQAQPPAAEAAPLVEAASPRPTEPPSPDAAARPASALPASDSLDRVAAELEGCTRCKLCERRKTIVIGEGNPRAELVFVGEGPGEQEDLQGRPFVGKAGQLLNRMITAMGLTRDQVYICNVVKCRPPGNRNPEPDEIASCGPFMERQIDAIRPKVVVALGKFSAQTLLRTDAPISRIRGRFQTYRGAKLMPTFHPAYLLRNPDSKREAWADLQQVAQELGLKIPPRRDS